MPKPPNDLSTLFRSLGPGSARTQAPPVAMAQAAEQRWPLLRSISPKGLAPPPALSEEDKSRWANPEHVGRAEKKPALSLPGVADKLTKSLEKMGGRSAVRPSDSVQPSNADKRSLELPLRTGLFTKPVEEPASQTTVQKTVANTSVADGDDSLVGIFDRLSKVDEPVVPVAPRKSSFLSRIGKK